MAVAFVGEKAVFVWLGLSEVLKKRLAEGDGRYWGIAGSWIEKKVGLNLGWRKR